MSSLHLLCISPRKLKGAGKNVMAWCLAWFESFLGWLEFLLESVREDMLPLPNESTICFLPPQSSNPPSSQLIFFLISDFLEKSEEKFLSVSLPSAPVFPCPHHLLCLLPPENRHPHSYPIPSHVASNSPVVLLGHQFLPLCWITSMSVRLP